MAHPSNTPVGRDTTPSSLILRAITLHDILKYWPWQSSVSLENKMWDRLSNKVEDADNYDIFISHAWESNSLLKVAALAIRHNSLKAVLISLILCWLLCNIDVPAYIKLTVPCLCSIICIRWGFLLTFTRSPRVFFDRCCIPQNDSHMKLMCIRSIPKYLQHSKSLVLMWDKPFTSRLWCMFEFAIFMKTHGSNKLEVFPLVTVKFALVFFSTSFFFWFCHELFDNIIPVVVIDIIFVTLTGWYVIVHFFPRSQEGVADGFNLKTEKLECSLKTDKDILLSYVRSVHGSYSNFDKVSSRICRDIVCNLGQQPFLFALTCLSILPSTLAAHITGGFITSIIIATFPNLLCCIYCRLIYGTSFYGKAPSAFLMGVLACVISFGILCITRYIDAFCFGAHGTLGSSSFFYMYVVISIAHVFCCMLVAAGLTRSTFSNATGH